MNVTIPLSLVHAHTELREQQATVNELLADKKLGKRVDQKYLQDVQERIYFLRKWIKGEWMDNKDSRCFGCQVLVSLYRDCKDVLPPEWKKTLWNMLHKSSQLNMGSLKGVGNGAKTGRFPHG